MKTRRLLAIMLSLSMIISSEVMSVNAYAAATDETAQITELSEPDETGALIAEEDIVESKQTQSDGSAVVIPIGAAEIDSGSGSESVVIEASPEDGTEDEETVVVGDDGAAVSAEPDGTEAEIETIGLLGEASSIFTVDEQGVLRYADGVTGPTSVIVIPKEAKIIPENMFSQATNLEEVTFEGGSLLQEIGAGAFEYSGIASIDIPDGVTAIGNRAFEKCPNLTYVTGASVATVGVSAFDSCRKLSYLDLPEIEVIGNYAFNGCSSLVSMTFPSSLSDIGNMAFSNTGLAKIDLSGSDSLSLGEYAFSDMTSLKTVILPDELDEIPGYAFYRCTALASLTIGTGSLSATEAIRASAFEGCTSLKSVITYNVSIFETRAFASCTGLTSVVIHYPYPDNAEFVIGEDAFPDLADNSKLTMKGYDGKVKEYAASRKYKYESLLEPHTVKVAYDKERVKVTASASKAVSGEEIVLKVTPLEGYAVESVTAAASERTVNVALSKNDGTTPEFTFTMPDCDITLTIKSVKSADAMSKNLSYRFEPVNGYSPFADENGVVFDMAGRAAWLIMTDKSTGKDLPLQYFTFQNNNNSVTVDSRGYVRAISKVDNALITVTSRTNSTKLQIPVSVKADTVISEIALKIPEVTPHAIQTHAEIYDIDTDGEDVIREVPMLVYDKAALSSGNIVLDVGIEAYTGGVTTRSLIADSKWTSSDTAIATVKSAASKDNSNRITIKKGAVGETVITITVNGEGGEPTEDTTVQFIVRAADTTPRMAESAVTVNSVSTVGTVIHISPVYGYEIYNNDLTLHVGSSTGTVCSDLAVVYDRDTSRYYIRNKTAKTLEKEYKDKNKLYITGKLVYGGEIAGSFSIPITQVTVKNAALNPTIKMTGKINLFYRYSVSDSDLSGTVKLTQSVKDAEIEEIYLVGIDYYKDGKKVDPENDPFALNFNITQVDNQNYIITRTDSLLWKNDDGSDAVSGYLYLKYAGYNTPVWKSIKIPTYTTSPEYVLNITSATASTYASDQEYELWLLDKKTKKKIVSLEGLDTDTYESDNYIGLGLSSGLDIFEVPDIDEAISTDVIRLKVKDGTPQAGKAVIYVQDKTWSKPLKYTFTLKTTSALPKATLSAASAVINQAFPNQSASLYVKLNQDDASPSGFEDDAVYTGKANVDSAMGLLDGIKLDDDGVIEIGSVSNDVKEATYKFKAVPTAHYGDGDDVTLDAVSFSVKVVNKKPALKLKSGTFKLNKTCAGEETVSTAYSFTNLPTGAVGELDINDLKAVPVKVASPDLEDIAKISGEDGVLSIQLVEKAKVSAGSYAYTLEGLRVKTDDDEVELADTKITLKITDSKVTLTPKASGTLNPIDAASYITYTMKISNYSGQITDVAVKEKDDMGGYYQDDSKQHFVAELSPSKKNVALLYIDDDKYVESGKVYNLTLRFTIGNSLTKDVDVKVTPKQTYPTLNKTLSDSVLYASVAPTERYATVKLTQAEPAKGKTAMAVNIEDVILSSDNSNAVKKAFRVTEYDEDTGVVTIWLANPSYLAANTDYTVKLTPLYSGQDLTKFQTISVKFTIKR